MDAAEVLPWSAMSRAIRTALGQLHGARHRVDDAHVGLVGHEDVEVVGGDAGAVEGLLADLRHREADAQRKTGLPCMTRWGMTPLPGTAGVPTTSRQSSFCRIRSYCSPSEPQTTGPMPAVSLGPDHGGAGAVGEDERGAAVVEVGDVAEPLDADHQHVAGAAAADHVGAERDAVAEARAGGGDVERRGVVGAELVGDGGGDRGRLEQVGDGGDDDAVDLLGRRCRPARCASAAAPTDITWIGLVGGGPAALLDAGALLDPLVAGLDRLDDRRRSGPRATGGRRRGRGSRRAGRR